MGEINGNWLIVNPKHSKTGVERQIRLGEKTLSILIEMKNNVDNAVGKSGAGSMSHTRTWQIKKYSGYLKRLQ